MKKIINYLANVPAKYLWVAIVSILLTYVLGNVGIEWGMVPMLFVAFFVYSYYFSRDSKPKNKWFALPITLGAIVMQIVMCVF